MQKSYNQHALIMLHIIHVCMLYTNTLFYTIGQSISDLSTAVTPLDPVQNYCLQIKQNYQYQPIVASDWPPRVGEEYFGRLVLHETQDKDATPKTIQDKQWYMLRGDIDQICEHTNDKQIDTVDILEPNEDGQSLRVVVDGPPGIGKTTLCRKLLNLWAKGELKQHYELVLYCPFRDQEIANASTLELLLSNIYDCTEVSMVTEWILQNHGDQLLIIFDGWDELSIELRQTSLASRIICNKLLRQCSVIVTSRSYASSSLLKLNTISKHIEVKGFSNEEVNNVIQCTLPQLNKEIEIRNDVQSLCYIPLVCSIVVYVCKSSEGQLPKTLTKLYKKFIVETINRHVEIKQIPAEIAVKLSSLPSPINNIFSKLCKLAYDNLKQNPPKLTFSSSELPEDYLGLMTSFAEYGYGKKTYQFLHLSIQEFLAAWWITKYEKTEELFKDHFENEHFRLCLRFVAGLTHLEHKSYQQYFNKPIDLQCKRKPLFGYDAMYLSWFHQNPEIEIVRAHVSSYTVNVLYDKFDVLLLQLLYESQNTTLCHILAQSMINQSLCLYGQLNLSLFDILCLSYFLNNSNITWKYLDLGRLHEQEVQIITDTITNNSQQNQCNGLEIELGNDVSPETTDALFQLPFFCHIQHCTLETWSNYFPLFSQLQQMKVLNFGSEIQSSDKYIQSRLQQFIETNTTVQELAVYGEHQLTSVSNKTIQSLRLLDEVPNEIIEQLLKNNYTLKALSVTSKSTLNIHEVNTPLDALSVSTSDNKFSNIMKIKGLKCLSINFPYPQYNPDPLMYPHLPQYPHSLLHCIFQSHPNLQMLDIKLDTSESVNELFTILQTNTTLKALRIELHEVMDLSIGLQDMLQHNKTIQYFHIDPYYSSSNEEFSFGTSDYLSYLTNGLSHNTSLQELMVPIPLSSDIKYVKHFFDVISQKTVTELHIIFVLDQTYKEWYKSRQEREMVTLLCNYGIPLVNEMLNSHNTMRLFTLFTPLSFVFLKQEEKEIIQTFCDTVLRHQYVGMNNISSNDQRIILKKIFNTTKKLKLPIINVV